MGIYYTYAYLRKDGTPYYIGKGCGKRFQVSGGRIISPPADPSRIIILKQNLSEQEAFRHEIYMIAVLGRKDLGTGILRNQTNGGDGASGYVRNPELREKDRQNKIKYNPCKGNRRWHNTTLGKECLSQECPGEGWMAGRLPSVAKTLRSNRKKQEQEGRNPRVGSVCSEETKSKIKTSKLGKKAFVNQEGVVVFREDAPGPEWQRGRKWK
jgi:hypothetical protein